MSDPGENADRDDEEGDPVEWLDGIEWSEEPPGDEGVDGDRGADDRGGRADGRDRTGGRADVDDAGDGIDAVGDADEGIDDMDDAVGDAGEGIDVIGDADAESGVVGDVDSAAEAGDAEEAAGRPSGAADDRSTEPGSGRGDSDTSAVAPDSDDASPSASAATTDRIAAALSAVRREVRKAALVHAAVEGALVAAAANLLLSLATPAALSGSLPLPAVVFGALRSLPAVGPVAPRTVSVASLVAAGIGGVGVAGAYLFRLRRPLIEQFEAANPPVREALRTARDAVEGGSDTEMARRLYGDVIATLRETSTLELVDGRRLIVAAALVAVLAVASVQVAVINPDLGGLLAGGNDPGATVEQPDDDELQDGDQILGDAENVSAGDEIENITVPGTGEGEAEGPTAPGGGTGGGGGSGEFDSQQAGYAGEERIEDAELVREYNLRIREFDDGTETDDNAA